MRSKKKLLATIGVSAACLSMAILTPPAASASELGPVGPCDQNSGVASWSTSDGWTTIWHFTNCNSYGINIAPKYWNEYTQSSYYGSCGYLAPGGTREAYSDLIHWAENGYTYC